MSGPLPRWRARHFYLESKRMRKAAVPPLAEGAKLLWLSAPFARGETFSEKMIDLIIGPQETFPVHF